MLNKDIDMNWQEFLDKLIQINNKCDLEIFLQTFLTLTEKSELTKRYLIIKELLQHNKTQREIAKDLEVSIANVTRGSNVLKSGNKKLLKILKIGE